MSQHPFPSNFSSPVATPSPTKENNFPVFPSFTLQATGEASSSAIGAAPSHANADATQNSKLPPTASVNVRPYKPSNSRRSSRPRLSSLQSLNSVPASPSLTEQDSGRAYISSSRLHTSHPSLSRASSRNAVETLQPLAESTSSLGKLKVTALHPFDADAMPRSPQRPTTQPESSALPSRARRTSTSPTLVESGLSEFGQMGAPFADNSRHADRTDVSAKLRNLHTSTGAFLRRSHTITAGISSVALQRDEASPAKTSPPPSTAMTYGPSSGRNVPRPTQRRQTVSNVSPDSVDRLAHAQPQRANAAVSPSPSRTLSYTQPSPNAPPAGSTLSVSSPSTSRLRQRGALPNNQLEAKVVILGSQGVGKTSLVHRYTSGQFSIASTPSTIGASFLTKKLIVESVKVRLQLWDTAGQERFRSMAPMYYRGSHAAVIVYDITSMSSFLDIRTWIEELKKNMTTDLVIHIVGAKLDLAWSQRQVELDFARATVGSWLQMYQTQPHVGAVASAGSNDLDGSPGSPTRSTSRLSGLGSLAIGSASRLTSFQRTNSAPGWPNLPASITSAPGTAATTPGAPTGLGALKPSSFGSSGASSGSAGSDAGRADALDRDFTLSWDLVEVSEVSAKDDRGIEEVFLAVTKKLVERRTQIEQERASRERNSIFLSGSDAENALQDAPAIVTNSWTCCG
ncbi:GTP-binding protein YPT52 [Pseudozyma hubeiensis]|nr:GTP-binding protein YPT52 [Pseudozyma hubeiensis]